MCGSDAAAWRRWSRRLRGDTDAPLVVLAQEVYRSDATVPARPAGRAARRAAGSFPIRTRPRADIVEAAHALGLNLRYAPSMRNGAERSDRGNAILSDLPLSHAWAFELPLVLERRVPLAATLLLAGGPVHVVSAHLDPRGPPGAAWLGVAGRAKQAAHLVAQLGGDLVILGADLNLGRGRRERAWRLLHEAGVHRRRSPPRRRSGGTRFMRSGRAAAGAGLRAAARPARARGVRARGAARRAPARPRSDGLRLRPPSASGARGAPPARRDPLVSELLNAGLLLVDLGS